MQTHQNETRTASAKHESTLPNISLLKNTKAKDSTHPQLLRGAFKKKTPSKENTAHLCLLCQITTRKAEVQIDCGKREELEVYATSSRRSIQLLISRRPHLQFSSI